MIQVGVEGREMWDMCGFWAHFEARDSRLCGWISQCKRGVLGRGSGKWLLSKQEHRSPDPEQTPEKPAWQRTCNVSVGEGEMGGFPELAGQPI